MTLNELEVKIRNWAIERNIDKSENAPKQMIKIMEELGETSAALLKKNEPELKDGIGDITFTTPDSMLTSIPSPPNSPLVSVCISL